LYVILSYFSALCHTDIVLDILTWYNCNNVTCLHRFDISGPPNDDEITAIGDEIGLPAKVGSQVKTLTVSEFF